MKARKVLGMVVASMILTNQMTCLAGSNDRVGDLSYNLFKLSYNTDNNILVSPYSLLTAIDLAEGGANGATLDEFKEVIGDNSSIIQEIEEVSQTDDLGEDGTEFAFNTANSVWVNEGMGVKLLDSYDPKGAVFARDFNEETKEEINTWVSDQTKGMIENMLNKLDNDVAMVLINALSFVGNWEEAFSVVEGREFTDVNGDTKPVPAIHDSLTYYYELKDGGLMAEEYYKGGKFKFMAILPPEGVTLEEYIKTLSYSDIINAKLKVGGFNTELVVTLEMPKFSYDYENDMVDIFKSLGLKECFGDTADFSRMSKTPMYIGAILHKTHIEVDEYGTKAAAATAIMELKMGMSPKKQEYIDIILDRPFMYLIMDEEHNIPIFIGAVNEVKGE